MRISKKFLIIKKEIYNINLIYINISYFIYYTILFLLKISIIIKRIKYYFIVYQKFNKQHFQIIDFTKKIIKIFFIIIIYKSIIILICINYYFII